MRMDSAINNIRLLLKGENIEESQEFCDFTLETQNEIADTAAPAEPFTATLKTNVCYIVAAVLVNENDEVLMMQEAKRSCAGQWYLPAGRLEPGENISDAAKREVLEETGLEMEVTTLLMVESASGLWYRFVVTGRVVGGSLKTPAQADSESLQAAWVKNVSDLSLRGNDINNLIEKARSYNRTLDKSLWHPPVLPNSSGSQKMLLKTIIVARKKTNNRMCALFSEKGTTHVPCTEINPNKSIYSTLRKYMMEIFGSDLPPHRPQGVLAVDLQTDIESGKQDGVTLTILIPVKTPMEDITLIDKYSWLELPRDLGHDVLKKLEKNMIVALNVIR